MDEELYKAVMDYQNFRFWKVIPKLENFQLFVSDGFKRQTRKNALQDVLVIHFFSYFLSVYVPPAPLTYQ